MSDRQIAADMLARLVMVVAIKTATDEWLAECILTTPYGITRKLCAETLANHIARRAGL